MTRTHHPPSSPTPISSCTPTSAPAPRPAGTPRLGTLSHASHNAYLWQNHGLSTLIDAEPLPGYQAPYGLLCAILQDGTNEWRWELDQDLSEDAVVWQPHPDAHSLGAII